MGEGDGVEGSDREAPHAKEHFLSLDEQTENHQQALLYNQYVFMFEKRYGLN